MQKTTALFAALVVGSLMVLMAIPENMPATAGESMPNVTGRWEGNWVARQGSGQVTFNLLQEGNKVTGRQSVVGVLPVFSGPQQQIVIGQEVRDGEMDGSILHFHVTAENVAGRINFNLTVSGDTMSGSACGDQCARLRLTKAKM